jgi:serine/threonine-protein kinase RsbW
MLFPAWNMPPEPDGSLVGAVAGMTGVRPDFVVRLGSSTLSVRQALVGLRPALAGLACDADAAGSIELVLAEVLNNIGEHAYRGMDEGSIQLSVWASGDTLHFEARDAGLPMPNGRMPAGRAARVDCPLEEIPEGGFGWYLIRHLTADLHYARVGEINHLTFRMRRDARPPDG